MLYLLKPIDVDELKEATNNAKERVQEKKTKTNSFESILNKLNLVSRKIIIPTSEGVMLSEANEIVRMESDSNYTHIYFKDGKSVLVSKTLKHMEEQLNGLPFCRVHNAHVVNLNEIERYMKGDGGNVILKNKTSIPVSRAFKQDLMQRLGIV